MLAKKILHMDWHGMTRHGGTSLRLARREQLDDLGKHLRTCGLVSLDHQRRHMCFAFSKQPRESECCCRKLVFVPVYPKHFVSGIVVLLLVRNICRSRLQQLLKFGSLHM